MQQPGHDVRHFVWDGLVDEIIRLQFRHAEVVTDHQPTAGQVAYLARAFATQVAKHGDFRQGAAGTVQ